MQDRISQVQPAEELINQVETDAKGRLPVTIVVLSAGASPFLDDVLKALNAASPGPESVQVIWSARDPVPPSVSAAAQTRVIDPQTFDHGGTRGLALQSCKTDLLAFLSDDAPPVGPQWVA